MTFPKMAKWAMGLLLFLIILNMGGEANALPQRISYQGKLLDAQKAPLNGSYSILFTLYTSPSGNTSVWSELYNGSNKIQVVNGYFYVELGKLTPLTSVVFNSNVYLGVKVDDDAEMTPRTSLLTVPYAFSALSVDGLNASTVVRNNTNNTITGNITVYGTVTATRFVGDGSGLSNVAGGGGSFNGTLPISQGGTGATTTPNARTNLGLGLLAVKDAVNLAGSDVSGLLPVQKVNNLGLLGTKDSVGPTDFSGILGVEQGGTGANTAADARGNLGLGALSVLSSINLSSQTTGLLPLAKISGLGKLATHNVIAESDVTGLGLLASKDTVGPSDFAGVLTTQQGGTGVNASTLGDVLDTAGGLLRAGGTMTGTLIVQQNGFRTAGSNGQFALANGSVGIGTSNPDSTYKLSVIGKIGASSDINSSGNIISAGTIKAVGFVGDGSLLTNLNSTGITGLVGVSQGGTGANTAAGARANLGVVIGTDVQAQDSELGALAGLTSAANKLPYFTGSGTAAVADLSANGRSLLAQTSSANMRSVLGVFGTGQAAASGANNDITSLSGLSTPLSTSQGGTGINASTLGDVLDTAGGLLRAGGTMTGTLIVQQNGFRTAGSNGQFALANGSVGIGTSNPDSTYKLSVIGKIGASSDINSSGNVVAVGFAGNGASLTNLSASALTGTVTVARGGTGAGTLTGYLKGNGTSAFTANATIPTSDINGKFEITAGGTGATTASGARVNLGLAIGTDVQAYDAELGAIAGLTSAANKLPYFTGSGTAAVTDLSANGRSLLAQTSSANMRSVLGVANAAQSGANNDITSLSGLSTPLSTTQGGTGINASTLGDVLDTAGGLLRAGGTMTGTLIVQQNGFRTAGSNGQFALANGSVGIGTSNPDSTYKLSVIGKIGASGDINSSGNITAVGFSGNGASLTNLSATALTGTVTVAHGGTGVGTLTGYLKGNGTSAFTANATIPTTDINGRFEITAGGTGATTASGARSNLGAAASGANSDITSLSGLSTPLSTSQGGTGINASTLGDVLDTAGGLLRAGGTMTGTLIVQQNGFRTAGSNGQFALANGSVGIGTSNPDSTYKLSVIGKIGASGDINSSGNVTAVGFAGNGASLTNLSASALTGTVTVAHGGTGAGTLTGYLKGNGTSAFTASTTIPTADINGKFEITAGGTGATTASGARGNLGAAASGANSDITSLSGLSTPLSTSQGGTGVNASTLGDVLDTAGGLLRAGGTMTGTLIVQQNGFRTAGSNGQFALANGSVGIGTSNPDSIYKLSVIGKIGASGDINSSGNVTAVGFSGNGASLTNLSASALTGTVAVANGGTGVGTLTGYLKGNGTSAFTASATIPTSDINGKFEITAGGTGATTASGARTNLGLAIGTNVQAYDAELAALAGLTSAADKLPYFTGSGTAGITDLGSAGRNLIARTTSADLRSVLVVAASGANSDITSLSGLTTPLTVAQGGTGAATLTGYTKGNGTSAFTASATIPTADINGKFEITSGGTGATTASGARTNLGAAARGANSDITSLTGITSMSFAGNGIKNIYAPFEAGALNSLSLSGMNENGGSATFATDFFTIYTGVGAAQANLNTVVTIGGAYIYRAGGTDIPVTDGGTGASTAADARTNLGLAIGTDVQAYDAELAAVAGLTSAANKLPYFTGSGTAGVTDFSSAGRDLVARTTSADLRSVLVVAGRGANSDITSLSALSTPLTVAQGGTGTTALTQGSVVFAGASGVYSQNNAGLFWDNSNSRLGIGVTLPEAKLHVAGGGAQDLIVGNYGSAQQLLLGTGSGYSRLQAILQGSGVNNLALNSGGGNVGVGTTSPSSLFSVGSSSQFQVNSSGAIAAATGISSSGTITFSGLKSGVLNVNGSGVVSTATVTVAQGGTGTATAFTQGSVHFAGASGAFSQDNTNFFWDNTNKRLGLGVTTPSKRLSITSSTSQDGVYIQTTTFPEVRLYDGANTGIYAIATTAGGYASGTTAGATLLYGSSDIQFLPSATLAMTLKGTGRLGIGTTSPSAPLDIKIGGEAIRLSGTTSQAYMTFYKDATRQGYVGTGAGGDNLIVNADFDAIFQAGNSEKMRLTSAGNLGVGTSSTSYKMEVNGTIKSTGMLVVTTNTSAPAVMTILGGTDGPGHIAGIGFSTSSTLGTFAKSAIMHVQTQNQFFGKGDMVFAINSDLSATPVTLTNELMRLTSAGRLGIGNTSPGSKVGVNGNLSVGNSYAGTGAPSNGAIIQGNVGIGTSSPSAILHIAADDRHNSLLVKGYSGGTDQPGIYLERNAGSKWNMFAGSSGGLYFYEETSGSAAYRMVILSGGNVGIGANLTSPTHLLQLNVDDAYKPNGGSWGNTSDQRIKKDIKPMDGALDKLLRIQGVTFKWKNPEEHSNQTEVQGGFIAQNIETVFPGWIKESEATGKDKAILNNGKIKVLSLPFEFDAVVVESIKELNAKNTKLEAEVKELRLMVQQLLKQQAQSATPSLK
jgi:hypothetical protein